MQVRRLALTSVSAVPEVSWGMSRRVRGAVYQIPFPWLIYDHLAPPAKRRPRDKKRWMFKGWGSAWLADGSSLWEGWGLEERWLHAFQEEWPDQ